MAEKAAMNIECWLSGLWVLTNQRVTHAERDACFYLVDERGILNRVQRAQKIPIIMNPGEWQYRFLQCRWHASKRRMTIGK